MRQLLENRLVRVPLYGLFTLVVFLTALVWTFPDERVKQIVVVQAEQALNGGKIPGFKGKIWEVSIVDLDLWWFTGLELEGVMVQERWSDEKKARVEAEAQEGAPPVKPISVLIPRVAGRVSLVKSVANLGLGAVYDVDFEEGGLITGDFVQRSDGGKLTATFESVDLYKVAILQTVLGVPGFGELNGEVELALDAKTGQPVDGLVDLTGKKITVGPATVRSEMIPSMAFLEVPQTNFGNLVMRATIEGSARGPKLTFEEVHAQGRDVRMDIWGDIVTGKVGTANVDARLQFDATFVKENNLSPLLNVDVLRSGKSADDWYGISLKGALSKLRPRGSVVAARGPGKAKPAKGASGEGAKKERGKKKGTKKKATKPSK